MMPNHKAVLDQTIRLHGCLPAWYRLPHFLARVIYELRQGKSLPQAIFEALIENGWPYA